MISTPNTLACEAVIDLLSSSHKAFRLQPVENLEELEQLWKIDKDAYGDCSLTLEEFSQWWQRYEFGSRCLWLESDLQASIGIYPLYQDQATSFMKGVIRESELTPATVAECEFEPKNYWYASGIVVRSDLRGWGSPLKTLLQAGLSSWLDSGHLAYPLTLLSIAEYEIGRKLLQFFGFEKVQDGSNLPDGCDLYAAHFDSRREISSFIKQKVR